MKIRAKSAAWRAEKDIEVGDAKVYDREMTESESLR